MTFKKAFWIFFGGGYSVWNFLTFLGKPSESRVSRNGIVQKRDFYAAIGAVFTALSFTVRRWLRCLSADDYVGVELNSLAKRLPNFYYQVEGIERLNLAVTEDLRFTRGELEELRSFLIRHSTSRCDDFFRTSQDLRKFQVLFYYSGDLERDCERYQTLLNAAFVNCGAKKCWDSGFDKSRDAMRVYRNWYYPEKPGWYIVTIDLLAGWADNEIAKSPRKLREDGLSDGQFWAGVEAMAAFALIPNVAGSLESLANIGYWGCDMLGLEQGFGFANVPYFLWLPWCFGRLSFGSAAKILRRITYGRPTIVEEPKPLTRIA